MEELIMDGKEAGHVPLTLSGCPERCWSVCVCVCHLNVFRSL